MPVKPVEWRDTVIRVLDQTRLPAEVVFLDLADYAEVAKAIREMRVRGAPAIGVAAAYGLALGAQAIEAGSREEFAASLLWTQLLRMLHHNGCLPPCQAGVSYLSQHSMARAVGIWWIQENEGVLLLEGAEGLSRLHAVDPGPFGKPGVFQILLDYGTASVALLYEVDPLCSPAQGLDAQCPAAGVKVKCVRPVNGKGLQGGEDSPANEINGGADMGILGPPQ
ncbi:hypothetical protein M1O13_03260 [Dehalococcoidia bacterium]|nr:hypothetical protein [Dehalococcoidia bacterium]